MSQVFHVRECEACSKVCDVMDTVCPRCRQYGTLRERLQCMKCQRLLFGDTCEACAGLTEIRAGAPGPPVRQMPTEIAGPPIPDVTDPLGVPAWLSQGIGGAVLGTLAGAVGAYFLNANPWIGALIGVVPGAALGAVMTGGATNRS